MDDDLRNVSFWRRVLRPTVLAALLSPILLVLDSALITVFILQQNWRAVILTSAMFLGGAQVIFWYFRAKTLLVANHERHHQQVRPGLVTGEGERDDDPPTYDEVIKTEAPPPPYYMVVSETHSASTSSNSYGEDAKTKTRTDMFHSSHKEVPREVPIGHEDSQEHSGLRSTSYAITTTSSSPFIHERTRDEGSQRSAPISYGDNPRGTSVQEPTLLVHQDPVEAIRTPIIREIQAVTTPTHLPTVDRHASDASVR
ncbi:uncharacterized protein [Panulirus ornatus]|uniref:uncharacterized protein n=1 Tax=Panulirus ornatus TaxID=150431 RepID=UPI003A85D290